jgi:hypothetical protein
MRSLPWLPHKYYMLLSSLFVFCACLVGAGAWAAATAWAQVHSSALVVDGRVARVCLRAWWAARGVQNSQLHAADFDCDFPM